MRNCDKPNNDFEEFFISCITKHHILTKLSDIITATIQYDSKASLVALHELQPLSIENLHPITAKDLKDLYLQMSRKKGKQRNTYDKLLAQAKKNKCCFCSYEDPTELDHFLPKSKFPEFSILLTNLIPSCKNCNSYKGTTIPNSAESSYIHPYYEKYDNYIWLEANLSFDCKDSLIIFYKISTNLKAESPKLAARIEYQFKGLKLDERYASWAITEVVNIEHMLKNLKDSAGKEKVRCHLNEQALSRKSVNKNSWQSALYHALYKSEKFYNMEWKI
jgi:hypothetical protein